ncbi:MAG: hypothetical protein ACI9T8_000340 [Candidatus Saccharimonadales bacterium]
MLRQIKSKISFKRVSALFALIVLVTVSLSAPLSAQTVTQGYSTDALIQRGMLVSLDAEDTNKVVQARQDNEDRLHGVVVSANDQPFTLSDEAEKTFVATVGRVPALVSTEAGIIQPGDFLTISNITGIAMKAGALDRFTVGKALESFDGDVNAVSTTEVVNSLGETGNIGIGRIDIDIGVGSNPLLKPTESNLPGFLQKATETVAGRPLSTIRVYVGTFIFLAAASVSGSLLIAGVRSSLISIGRNPLSKKSITKSLFQIILTSIIIFLIGLFGVYLLLRL